MYDKNIDEYMIKNKKKKILVCGLGPVGGFFVTYLTYKFNDDFEIIVYDPKLGEFSRKQILTLQPLILDMIETNLPKIIFEKMVKIGCYVHNPEKAADAKCYVHETKDKYLSIRTMDIEMIFYEYIKENLPKVKLFKRELSKSRTVLRDELKTYDYCISATGGRDKLGELIGNKYKKEKLSNGMIITFDPKRHKIYDNESEEMDKHVKKMMIQNRYRGYKSKRNNYYIGVQLGDNEIDELQKFVEEKGEITYKNMPEHLFIIIKNGLMKYEMEDNIKMNTLNVSFFPIIRKYSTVPADYINKKSKDLPIIFMVGDSLTTPHFFSGMGVNSGFKMAYTLINLLKSKNNKDNNKDNNRDNDMILKVYNKMAKQQITEIGKWAKIVSVDMDKVDDMCQKYTKKDIYQLAKHNKLVSENMSKREVCLSLNRIMK